MWAGLLVPMWLRRHEQETEVRSVDRFATAMRILSRRTPPPPDKRYLVMPQRPPTATLPVADVPRQDAVRRRVSRAAQAAKTSAVRATRSVDQRPAQSSRRPAPRRRPSGRSRLIVRRRRIVLGLLALAGLMFILAVSGAMSWWWQLVSDLAVIAYLAHLRA